MKNNILSLEELTLIRNYIFCGYCIDVCQNNLDQMKHTPSSLKMLYVVTIEALMDVITKDHVKIKQEMKKANIKVVESDRNPSTIFYKIYFRGYTDDSFLIGKDIIKGQIGILMGKYVKQVEDILKPK